MTSSPSQHDSYVERIHGGGFQYTERSKTRKHYNICGVSVGVISSVFVELDPCGCRCKLCLNGSLILFD